MVDSCGSGADQYFASTKGMCRTCRSLVDARYIGVQGKLYLERRCPEHGRSRALVADSVAWYLDALKFPSAARPPPCAITKTLPCPEACGPCSFHAQRCNLPVFSITNACDLRCPICFTFNRSDRLYTMSVQEFQRHIDFVVDRCGAVDLINVTGGEPTLHPELMELLKAAQRPEIGRVTVNTNGLRLASDPQLAQRLADSGAYVVLSLDTLRPETSERIHGRDIVDLKKRALENLERFKVPTTLLMVMIRGVNDQELAPILDLMLQRGFIRSLTIQTMTYTGQGGGVFLPRAHLPVDEVARAIDAASQGRIPQRSFFPLPTAHPLCYAVTFLLSDGRGGLYPMTDLASPQSVATLLCDGYLPRASEAIEQEIRSAVDRLWSRGENPALLAAVKQLLQQTFPSGQALSAHQRQRLAEPFVKTIYIHAHMDEDTYELGRAIRCPDQVPVDAQRLIGACNYNLFYRMRDPRFWVSSSPEEPCHDPG